MASKTGKQKSGKISKRMQARAEERRKQRQKRLIIGAAVAVMLLLAVAAAFVWDGLGSPAVADGLPAEVDVATAYEMVQNGAFLLDVREQYEWDVYHAPQATLIPLGELADRVDEVPRDREIVVICNSGNRSQEGRDILLVAGFERVTSSAGGIIAWDQAGYPTE